MEKARHDHSAVGGGGSVGCIVSVDCIVIIACVVIVACVVILSAAATPARLRRHFIGCSSGKVRDMGHSAVDGGGSVGCIVRIGCIVISVS